MHLEFGFRWPVCMFTNYYIYLLIVFPIVITHICVKKILLTEEEEMACAAAAAAVNASDSESQSDDVDMPVTNLDDIADDDDIDENLFDGDDLDIVEQQLDSLDVVDWPPLSAIMGFPTKSIYRCFTFSRGEPWIACFFHQILSDKLPKIHSDHLFGNVREFNHR